MTLFALRWPCGAPSRTSPLSLLPLLLGGWLGVAEPCLAQNPPPPSQAQGALERAIEQNPGLADVLRQRIQQSGLTPEQVRARLQAGGYPSNLLDPYLSATPLGQGAPAPGVQELTAIQALGLQPIAVRVDSLPVDTGLISSGRGEGAGGRSRVFGVDVVVEMSHPEANRIISLGTVLTGLYAAGGVTERANMRGIQIQRLSKTVATLDLYDYLLRGDTRNDIRLETGDVIFVPVHGTRVQISGGVLRPAIYELGPSESLSDLIRVAGGFRADAELRRIAIHRILVAGDRGPGPVMRTVVDVALPLASATTHGSAVHRGEDPMSGVIIPTVGLQGGVSGG